MRNDMIRRGAGALVVGVLALAGCSPGASPTIEPNTGTASGTGGTIGTGGGTTAQPGQPGADPASPKAHPVVPQSKRWRPGGQQLGMQVYAHTAGGRPADQHIASILDYVVTRGANSVAFSFPLYTDGQRPTKVFAGKETPSPAVVGRIAAAAHQRGLRVTLRPLLDEDSLRTPGGGWRGTIKPPDLAEWFRSYTTAITPYLQVADSAGAEEFVLTTELTSLQSQHAHWKQVAAAADKVFPGVLSYTFNWDAGDSGMTPPDGSVGLDLYFDVNLGPGATVEQLADALTRQIMVKPKDLRAAMVAQEVGIAAEDGAYRKPWLWGRPGATVDPKIQVNWFTAACRAVERTGLKGIYFWMVDSSIDPKTVNPSTEGSAGFIGRPGEKAIERCFSGSA